MISHNAACCHLIASNKALKMKYRLSSDWTKRNRKYIPNFSEELFLKQNKNSQVDLILKQSVAMQVTKTHLLYI
jgi:transcription initiation factor TFIIIB Brf1 subunit/transcription initiation factor TFIIB